LLRCCVVVAELLLVFLNLVDDAEAEEREEAERLAAAEKEKKREAIRNKVMGVTKMLRLFKNIRWAALLVDVYFVLTLLPALSARK
jgi:hypothetical protein